MYDTLLLSAGGGLGWAYIGAMEALLEENKLGTIKTIAGISIGSVIGFLFQLNYNLDFLKKLILTLNFPNLENCQDTLYFLENFGFDNGEKLMILMESILKERYNKTDLTFKEFYELTKINYIVQATNLNKYCLVSFSHLTTPDLSIKTAIRMSITVPFYYTPIKYENDYYVDGGVLTSVPYIEDLINNKNVITLHVKRLIQPETHYASFIDYMLEVWLCFMNNRIEKQLNVDTIEFTLEYSTLLPTSDDIDSVIKSGYEITKLWLEKQKNKTSNITLDTANITLDTANITLDTANITLDTANITLDTANKILDKLSSNNDVICN
jgi:hypothetical protein